MVRARAMDRYSNIMEPEPPNATIAALRGSIDDTFARLDLLCASPAGYLLYRPDYPDAWTAAEHLEHVSLVNHFLLLTIRKGVTIALRRAKNRPITPGESDLARLDAIGDPDAFPWEPPGHMIPGGAPSVSEVRARLDTQRRECRQLLGRMEAGEGKLCCFRMSVNDLGKLDMFQWLCFLARHACWHLEFLTRRDSFSACERAEI